MRFPRASGLLLHITSLPGPHGSGDLGPNAYHFVDWLVAANQWLWQILPLGGAGPGNSPYMSSSAFAGNVMLIDLGELAQRGWLEPPEVHPDPRFDARNIDFSAVVPYRMARLAWAARRFFASAAPALRAEFAAFCDRNAGWLDDYALFMTLSEQFPGRDWCDWDPALAFRRPQALRAARARFGERVDFWRFCQWCFFSQFARLRQYANQRNVKIVGDAPIFIAHHSAECWARPDLFKLDAQGRPTVVAGVPPDYFSATGQRWGNPLYRWEVHAREGFAWWIERVRRSFELVDLLRIDHFRGFVASWEIPAEEPTAIHGKWVRAPGATLFSAIAAALGPLPIIAEDLGVITPDVDRLRRDYQLPGMCILQFAWGEGGEQRFLPHNHSPDSVVYTGTHDNDTTLGWWNSAPESDRHHLREYLGADGRMVNWTLIRVALASVADSAVLPMQDVLDQGNEHRMNFPGKGEGMWVWRFRWSDVAPGLAAHLRHLSLMYQRNQPVAVAVPGVAASARVIAD
ncbi:MAG TPA: 4-alpha-glucanotransferase [Steroidobacteraceae bacterium]|nr:4-alpha-glucanotransferase [Steroidobacteraceae bacterium]